MTVKYTEEHEWLKQDGDEVIVGITEHAQAQLGDLVFVDGEVTAVNEKIVETPSLVNEDPLEEGWFFRMTLDDPSEFDDLMDEQAYKAFIG